MNKQPIYFDYMATTPVDEQVIAQMNQYLGIDGIYANPASNTHLYGNLALKHVEIARSNIASIINAQPLEIIFTSGATEANNLALFGAARFYHHKGRHIISVSTEHKSVLDPLKELELQGYEITLLKPDKNGLISVESLKNAIRKDTILVSIMHVNNEIGVIQDIRAFGEFLKDKGIIFHVDAAQSMGKLPIDVRKMNIHLLSFSAHKNYGPKGIGGLFVSHQPRIRLKPLIFGGGHEQSLRSGTLPTHQIVGMAQAFKISEQNRDEEQARILYLRDKLWQGIKKLPNIILNGDYKNRIAGNLNFSFRDIDGADLLGALSELCISQSSACSASYSQTSHVLKEIGVDDELIKSSIRLSLGRYTTESEVDRAIEIILKQITMLVDNKL